MRSAVHAIRGARPRRRARLDAQRLLFDEAFYASQFPASIQPPTNGFDHFWSVGVWAGFAPHPLFDPTFYLASYPDVLVAGMHPLLHYLTNGGTEGRDPHPLFDTAYYLEQANDAAATGANPLLHYLTLGARKGLHPHPLFDADFYVEHSQEAVPAGVTPLAHFIVTGASEGRDPHPLFSTAFYISQYGDEIPPGMNPLVHFLVEGVGRGFDPSPEFQTRWYRTRYGTPMSANPVIEYVLEGAPADRPTTSVAAGERQTVRLPNINSSVRLFAPLRATTLARERTVVILLSSLRSSTLSAGPLTALSLGGACARAGYPVEFVAIDDAFDEPSERMRNHVAELCDAPIDAAIDVVAAPPDISELALGPHDVLVATIWWSALQAQRLVDDANLTPFVYLVQDYEPLFYAASSEYALAHSTYGLPCVPLVNSSTLLDNLREQRAGWFECGSQSAAEPSVFEPRPDADLFYPEEERPDARPRRLLFYARPHHPRNLYEIALAALRDAVRQGAFNGWEFLAIGEEQPSVDLAPSARLEHGPWMSYPDYARLVRHSDVMLAPMLSPHPGHPALDMALAGGTAVTTAFGPKTAASFAWADDAVVAVAPTVDALSAALVDAAKGVSAVDVRRKRGRRLIPPGKTLEQVVPTVLSSKAFAKPA